MSSFKRAERSKVKLKLAICGPSGSGKTFSSLKIATGMGGRIAMIDTENESGKLYCDQAVFDHVSIGPPFSVDKYIGAIKEAEREGYDVLIIDSLSHAWSKAGGILDEVDKRKGGNAFTSGWREATPMHDRFIDTILQSPIHIIACMRSKTAYDIEKDEKGKVVPVKKGREPVQRAGLEYEFTVVLDMDNIRHTAQSGKDRTGMFDGKCFVPDESTGRDLIAWLNLGADIAPPQHFQAPVSFPAEIIPPPAPQEISLPFGGPATIGFPFKEAEIIEVWTKAGWPPGGILDWVANRHKKAPNLLTESECLKILEIFTKTYHEQIGGGNKT